MSSIFVNQIQSSTGNTVTIPSGVSLSLGGTLLSSSSILPNPSGNAGKAIKSNGSTFVYDVTGVKNVYVFTSSGSYSPSSGTTGLC